MIWICTSGKQRVIVDACRWFDAREVARQALGIPTYDGLQVQETKKKLIPNFVVTYEGYAMNGTLRMVVT